MTLYHVCSWFSDVGLFPDESAKYNFFPFARLISIYHMCTNFIHSLLLLNEGN